MTLQRLLFLLLACTWVATATAQYQWVDKDGRKVFSDRPPPMDIPQKNILKEPRALAPSARTTPAAPAADASATAPAQAAPASAPTGVPTASGTDKSLQEAKAKSEAEAQAKKKAEEEAKAKQDAQRRADNCQRARRTQTALAPGRLVGTTNAKGERVYMDDATRAAELKRAEQIIQSDCK